MARFLGKMLLVLLLVMPAAIMLAGNDKSSFVNAQDGGAGEADVEDSIENEEEDADVTVEADEEAETGKTDVLESDIEKEEDEDALKPSPDADTNILFVAPEGQEFPAGTMVRFLVGFTNKGKKDFTVETMDASFRYPQDFSFYIQNFTVAKYDRTVEPSRQATFEYMFTPSETFNARPFGLTINLNYKDADGKQFVDAVFNDTVNIVEADEGLDGETFFLYVFLAAVAVLLLVGAQQLLASFGKKRLPKAKPVVEMGTQNKGDVDFDWIPKEALVNHSPGRSPKQKTSPRQRRSKRNTGGDD